jgi:hypothetical protein
MQVQVWIVKDNADAEHIATVINAVDEVQALIELGETLFDHVAIQNQEHSENTVYLLDCSENLVI